MEEVLKRLDALEETVIAQRKLISLQEKEIRSLKELDPGDKELRLAFEEVTTRNVNAILAHGNTTRKVANESKNEVEKVKKLVSAQDQKLAQMTQQLAVVQGKLYSGGSV